jgi:hypothetical protein
MQQSKRSVLPKNDEGKEKEKKTPIYAPIGRRRAKRGAARPIHGRMQQEVLQ